MSELVLPSPALPSPAPVVAQDTNNVVPAVIAGAGERATRRFLEFFAATIRNPNTRAAYYRAVVRFFAWCEAHGLDELALIEPLHVAAYVEQLGRGFEKPTVKQHLAAVRMLFDWLAAGGVLAANPAAPVRGPKHVVKRGRTPVLTADEARLLLDSIDVSTVVGLRDRALIALMTYTFARISASVAMRVEDYYPEGKRWWVRLHEKGGKEHAMPAHRRADGRGHDAGGRLAHDSPPGARRRHRCRGLLPHLPGHREHRLPRQRRHTGERAAHGRAREPTHDQALRSHGRRDYPR